MIDFSVWMNKGERKFYPDRTQVLLHVVYKFYTFLFSQILHTNHRVFGP